MIAWNDQDGANNMNVERGRSASTNWQWGTWDLLQPSLLNSTVDAANQSTNANAQEAPFSFLGVSKE
jgi:Rps23 Pro-64 3,4-dihydroxylase Tpa1-like proline 4-hydroxylase